MSPINRAPRWSIGRYRAERPKIPIEFARYQLHQRRTNEAAGRGLILPALIANNHIRRGRLSRADAVDLVRMHDGKFSWTYLGCPIDQILREIEMTIEEIIVVCDRFTNKSLFQTNNRGQPIRDSGGNLLPLFKLN